MNYPIVMLIALIHKLNDINLAALIEKLLVGVGWFGNEG